MPTSGSRASEPHADRKTETEVAGSGIRQVQNR